ncbi:type VI secretion system contractile sheath small subunit [Roseateles koreensis]|uniref:Type VI secretion system contractile sheath small subunit n=1 Tax=Roseateles koreensis TaxID=2987526 RepID=A0ABT5KR44_9BURK|nr:type VI secretion system contractile sheath small subunit [Roseateles koreensis]MDC8785311.1 type VI secretion system contractile sheath small subunit [Roseateles koreensis]
MSNSFQAEIPAARVNIKLDVHTGGAQKKVELPLKMLVLGDFSNGKTKGSVQSRAKINVNKNNFDAVLADLNPSVSFGVKDTIAGDGSEIPVKLDFKNMKDFHPEQVAKKIPQLSKLMATRNLLKDLKSNLLDNATLRRELEGIVKDQKTLAALKGDLDAIAAKTATKAATATDASEPQA